MNDRPSTCAAAYSSRATLADAVVWSTKMLPGCHACKGAVSAQHHTTQVVVIAHAAKNDVGTLRSLARGGGGACTVGVATASSQACALAAVRL
jgi:hypothetical protein